VRLVDDDERPEDMAEVNEGMDRLAPIRALGAEFEPCYTIEGREVTLPPFGMRVDGACARVLGLKALDSGDDDHKTRSEVLGADRFEALPRHDERASPCFDKFLTVGMPSGGKG
jgi:hypothetical protein